MLVLQWTVSIKPPVSGCYQFSLYCNLEEAEPQRSASGKKKEFELRKSRLKYSPPRRETLMPGSSNEIIKLDSFTIKHWLVFNLPSVQRKMKMNLALMPRLWRSSESKQLCAIVTPERLLCEVRYDMCKVTL